jgi:hypothetical protein
MTEGVGGKVDLFLSYFFFFAYKHFFPSFDVYIYNIYIYTFLYNLYIYIYV